MNERVELDTFFGVAFLVRCIFLFLLFSRFDLNKRCYLTAGGWKGCLDVPGVLTPSSDGVCLCVLCMEALH